MASSSVPSPSPSQRHGVNFGVFLREMRVARNLTQAQVAAKVGCHTTYISKLEKGQKRPSAEVVSKLVSALGLSAQEEARLRFAANVPRRTLTQEFEALIAAIIKDEMSDGIAYYLLRKDLGRMIASWSKFVDSAQLMRRGELASAQSNFEELLGYTDLTPTVRSAAASYLARVYQRLGKLPDASERLTRVFVDEAIAADLPQAQAIFVHADFLAQQGDISLREGKYVTAERLYRDAHSEYLQLQAILPSQEQWLAHLGLALATMLLAKVAIFQRSHDLALKYCERAEFHWNQATPPSTPGNLNRQRIEGLLRTSEFKAWVFTRTGHFHWAEDQRNKVRMQADKLQLREILMKNRLYTGDDLRKQVDSRVEAQQRLPAFQHVSPGTSLEAVRGDVATWIEAADAAYTDVYSMCKEDGRWRDPLIYGLCLRNMAIIKRFQQKYADAQIYLIEAEKYEVDLNHQGRLPSIYEAWGDLDWDRGNRRAAKGHYENALAKLDTLEEPEEAQEVQRKRIQRRLVGLATYSHLHLSAEHQHEQVWHDWGKAIRELIRLVDEALWTTAIAPHTTQDMDETWIRELAEFEQLSGSRILAQNGLSMSLAKTLGLREETAVAHIHAVRYETLLRQLASPDADVTHDLCCRPAVEGAMSVPHHYARARGASRLLRNPTGTYRLDAGVFSLPLGFAVKGSRVLIELPPQTVKRWNMRIRPFLAEYGRARQLCYRFENPRLAQVLRDHFPVLVSLARYSNADIENPDSDEDSTQAWLDELLNQWKAPIPAI